MALLLEGLKLLTKSQIQIIHVAKSKLALDEDTYRDILFAQAGVRSSTALDYAGFKAVMKHFEACGFTAHGVRRTAHGQDRPGMATVKQIKKIYAVWWSLGGSYYKKGQERKALRGFLKNRFRVEHENFLSFDKAGKVIEALKAIQGRAGENYGSRKTF